MEQNTELIRLIDHVDNDIKHVWDNIILPYKESEKGQILDVIDYDMFYDYMMENSPIGQVIKNNLNK